MDLIRKPAENYDIQECKIKLTLNIIKANKLNFNEFITKFHEVREKLLEKFNTISILGKSNCGKSMLIMWLTDILSGETAIKATT